MTMRLTSLACACLLSATTLLAAAQPADMHDMGPWHRDPAKMERMHAHHLAELKSKLQLTAAQEASWATFTSALKPPADMHQKMQQDHAALDNLTTPERMEKMHAQRKEHMAAMNTMMDQHEEAIKTFYASLSADQKKTFDHEFMQHHRPHDKDHAPVTKP